MAAWKADYAKTIRIDNNFNSLELYNGLSKKKSSTPDLFKLSIKLLNTTTENRQLYLSIINPTLDSIFIFENGSTSILGDYQSFNKRKFKHINHVYPILLHGSEEKEIILNIREQHQYNNFRITLTTENNFIKTTNHDNFFIGIFFGLLFTYLLLLICLYIFSKSRFYLKYLTINVFMILIYLQFTGIGNQYVWFYSVTVQKYITIIAVSGYIISHIYFIRTFFSAESNYNIGRYLFIIFSTIMILLLISYLLDIYQPMIQYLQKNSLFYTLNTVFLGYGAYILVVSVYSYINTGRRESIWIISGTGLHIINWILFINNNYGTNYILNSIDLLKLRTNHVFIAPINFYLTTVEIIMVSIFLATNYYKLIYENNISSKKLNLLQKKNLNRFILGQEEERNRISSDVTDVILKDIQILKKTINSLKLKDDPKEILPNVILDIDKTIQDIRDISGNYIAPEIQKMSVKDIIITATNKLNDYLITEYQLPNITDAVFLNSTANINLYRILQEISNNIIKHANANHVTIRITIDEKTTQITIEDNGIGFNQDIKNTGIGLMNIESRVNLLNGAINISPLENHGTSINILIPIINNQ